MVKNTTDKFGNGLSLAISHSQDPELIESALPAYILLLDSMIENDRKNTSLLLSSSRLNLAYANMFMTNPERSKIISQKSFEYAKRASCLNDDRLCEIQTMPYNQLTHILTDTGKKELPFLYALSTTWALWIQENKEDWNAVAQLASCKAIMQHIVDTDENFEHGSVQIFLGIMETIVPPAMGGNPELSRSHFEKAISITGGIDLYAKVSFAEHYARLMFDRNLHDQLLAEVLNTDDATNDFTLSNILSKRRAKALLESADDYF